MIESHSTSLTKQESFFNDIKEDRLSLDELKEYKHFINFFTNKKIIKFVDLINIFIDVSDCDKNEYKKEIEEIKSFDYDVIVSFDKDYDFDSIKHIFWVKDKADNIIKSLIEFHNLIHDENLEEEFQ